MQLKLTQLWLFMSIQVALQGDKVLALEKLCGSSGSSESFITEKNTLGGKLTKKTVPNIKNWHKKPEKVKKGQKKGKKNTVRNA